MTISVCPATPAHVKSVLALWQLSEAHPTHTDDAASIERLIEHDPGALLLATDDGEVVGSVIGGWDGWRGSIYRLAVAPRYRRQGLAQRLVRAARERLAELGATRLQAIVVSTDEPAVGFWAASGWEQQTERLRFVHGRTHPARHDP
jgi:ribosomal protein S18 acetylase RimI-like enzyme